MTIVTAADVAGLATARPRGAVQAGWPGLRRERR